MKRYHNEFDEEITVCTTCEELINDGCHDDRERFHSPQETEGLCELCVEGE